MFTFKVHPAAASVTDGIQHGFEYLGQTWRIWVPVALSLAAITLVAFMMIVDTIGDDLYYTNRLGNQVTFAPDAGDRVLRAVPFLALYLVATAVAGWIFIGMAVAGLRGWKLTPSVVVTRGLVALASGLVLAVAIGAGVLVWAVVTLAAPGIGILSLFVLVPLLVYVSLRLSFSTYAIFEGFGPIEGLQESWRLAEGAVLRIFGWGLMGGLIGMGFSIIATMASAPLTNSGSSGVAMGQAITGGVGAVSSAFSALFMIVLYESQRARKNPELYPVVAYPAPPTWPGGYPQTPGGYPPAPGASADGTGAPINWPPEG